MRSITAIELKAMINSDNYGYRKIYFKCNRYVGVGYRGEHVQTLYCVAENGIARIILDVDGWASNKGLVYYKYVKGQQMPINEYDSDYHYHIYDLETEFDREVLLEEMTCE